MKIIFKTLLLKIAALPGRDQRWILRHLPESCRQQFHFLQGTVLLNEARHFGKYHVEAPVDMEIPVSDIDENLQDKPPLFQAIIRAEQGENIADENIDFIKTATRKIVFESWKEA